MNLRHRIRAFFSVSVLFLLFSCSDNGYYGGNVTFRIDKAMANKIQNAAKSLHEEEKIGLYLDITLYGSYEATQTLSVQEGETAVFADIPAGTKLFAVAEAYYRPEIFDGPDVGPADDFADEKRFVVFAGESEEITVKPGTNKINIVMKRVEDDPGNDPDPWTEPEIITSFYVKAGCSDETALGTESDPLGSINGALQKIIAQNLSGKAYTIYIDGMLEGGQAITQILTTEHASSLTITGKNGLDDDFMPRDSLDGGQSARTLEIYTEVPVTLTGITIENGICGVYINSDSADVTLGANTLVMKNTGSGVKLESGTLTLEGGSVRENGDSNEVGGGVCIMGGEFFMTEGTIYSNTALNGGGVFIAADATFDMSGGEIDRNIANFGSGVYQADGGAFKMSRAAVIGSSNDAYLTGYLEISDGMDGGEPEIKATLTPAAYDGDTLIISGSSVEFDSFAITPSADGKTWGVNSDGYLVQTIAYQEASWDEMERTLVYARKGVSEYTSLTDSTDAWSDNNWYVLESDLTISNRITVSGEANLILCDGATLTAEKGITLTPGNTLRIYAQEAGSGSLNAMAYEDSGELGAGIGGCCSEDSSCSGGTLEIHGGNITAAGAGNCAGIGSSGQDELDDPIVGGDVTIFGGTVNATGGTGAAGIGGRNVGGTVTVYGGTITASGTSGIGGGFGGDGGTVIIWGGSVTATGNEYNGAGIGGGGSTVTGGAGGTVEIHGGTVIASGSKGIGAGPNNADNGTLEVDDNLNIIAGSSQTTAEVTTAEDYLANPSAYIEISE